MNNGDVFSHIMLETSACHKHIMHSMYDNNLTIHLCTTILFYLCALSREKFSITCFMNNINLLKFCRTMVMVFSIHFPRIFLTNKLCMIIICKLLLITNIKFLLKLHTIRRKKNKFMIF